MNPHQISPGAVPTARGTESNHLLKRKYNLHCRVCRIPTAGADLCGTCARWLAISATVAITKRLLREERR